MRAFAAVAVSSSAPAVASNNLQFLLRRMNDPSPRQQSAGLTDGFVRADPLRFPAWMEGEWHVRSRPLANTAPLGLRFLPADLTRMRLGDVSGAAAAPLEYTVRFVRRGDSVVSDRAFNLKAVQNAAAGYARVDSVSFDGVNELKVNYSPFGKNGTYPGPSRADIYIQWRRQSDALRDDASVFAFAESTRSVLISSQRSASSVSDAETICSFDRRSPTEIVARQRVLRYLTPNPNSAEGLLWSEAQGKAVAFLDYELLLNRVGET